MNRPYENRKILRQGTERKTIDTLVLVLDTVTLQGSRDQGWRGEKGTE